MTIKKYIQDLSAQTATETVDALIIKLLAQMKSQAASPVVKVTKIKGPDSFTVQTSTGERDIVWRGSSPIGADGYIVLDSPNGNYGVA